MDREEFRRIQNRRSFFRECAGGIGIVALAQLLERDGLAAVPNVNPLAPKKPNFPAKAKSVIFMFMEGGPSQLDLFDPKPELAKWNGKPLPPSMTKDLHLAFTKPNAAVLASPRVKPRMTWLSRKWWKPRMSGTIRKLGSCTVSTLRIAPSQPNIM